MKSKFKSKFKSTCKCLMLVAALTAAFGSSAYGQQQDEKLGKLSFPTSCDPKVQAEFERGVAMVHSYWFLIARRTFEGVLREDPNCAMAYWGMTRARGGACRPPALRGQR
jgi:hypothetical protein